MQRQQDPYESPMTINVSAAIVQGLWICCNVLHDQTLEDTANRPGPDILAAAIVRDLQAALAQLSEIPEDPRS